MRPGSDTYEDRASRGDESAAKLAAGRTLPLRARGLCPQCWLSLCIPAPSVWQAKHLGTAAQTTGAIPTCALSLSNIAERVMVIQR